jgi:WD40 repeat protein
VQQVALSQNGKFVTTVVRKRETGAGQARVWGARDGRPVTPFFDHDLSADAIPQISPDGSVVVALQPGGRFQILDAKTGRSVVEARQGAGPKFNPDGQRFCYLDTPSREYRLLETSGWTSVGDPLSSPYPGLLCEFSPQGNRLVTAGDVQNGLTTMRVWDALTGARIAVIENREAFALFKQAAFSPDGRRLVAAADFAKSFQVWDVASGTPVTSSIPLTGRFDRALFSSDGRRIVTIFGKIIAAPMIQEWDAISGELATLPRAIRPEDATRLLSDLIWKPGAGYPKSMPDTRPVDDLTRSAQLLSLRRVDETGGLATISANEAGEHWQDLAAKYPSVFSRSPKRKTGQ